MVKCMKHGMPGFLLLGLFVLPGFLVADDAAKVSSGDIVMQEGDLQVTSQDMEGLFADMTLGQRVKIANQPGALSKLAADMLVLKKQVAAAEKQQLADDPQVQWKLELGRKKILASALIERWKLDYAAKHDVTVLAEEYYQAHPKEFIEPEQLKAAHILLKVEKDGSDDAEQRIKADELLVQLKSGSDFAEVAKEFSADGSASRGGDLGWFARGRMVKPFEKAAYALTDVGELSDVVRSDVGYHIIKLLGRKPQRQKLFEEVSEDLKKKSLATLQERELRDFLAGFEPTSDASLYVSVLDKLLVKLKAAVE